MADTAVLEPGTAVQGDDTASDEALNLTLPETESPEAPETDGEETPGDTGPDFASMTPEEIAEYIREQRDAAARDAEARARESERRKREAEVAKAREEAERSQMEARRSKAARDRDGEFVRDLRVRVAEVVKHSIDEGQPYTLHQAVIDDLVTRMAAFAAFDQIEAQAEVEKKLLKDEYPRYRPSQEVADQLAAAERSGDAAKVVAARRAQLTEAIRESLRAEVEAEVRDAMKAEQKAAAAKAQGAQRTNPDANPTAVGGTGGNSRLTFDRLKGMSASEIVAYRQRPGGKEEIERVQAQGQRRA